MKRTPYEEEPSISDLQEAILDFLEEAGIDTATNDQIVKLIAEAERRLYEAKGRSDDR